MKSRHCLTLATIVLGLAGMAMPAVAQTTREGRPGPMRGGPAGMDRPQPGMMIERFKEDLQKLDLTPDQKTQLDKIFADAKSQMDALRDQKDARPMDRRDKMREIIQGTREKAFAVLTPEQKEKAQAEFRQRMMREGGPLEHLQRVAQELNLTDDQKAKLQTIIADARKDFEAIREKAEANREAMGKLFRETRDKVNQLLTPEQSQKLSELLPGPRDGAGRGPGPGPRDGQGPRRGPRDGGNGGR